MSKLKDKYARDRKTWNECAETYEKQIVFGHPDIHAFECFEEDLLDKILRHLAAAHSKPLKLMDIGCGSGRLHIRYGAKTMPDQSLDESTPLFALKKNNPGFAFDPEISEKLAAVWGIDFSETMIDLAGQKISEFGLDSDPAVRLELETGSAFNLSPEKADSIPIAVCLVNSIGVMQGPEGAEQLFQSMKRAVETAAGIAIISCYKKEFLETYGLGQYESTMDVSGQPIWLVPDLYSSPEYILVPIRYKLAYCEQPDIPVDVFDCEHRLIKRNQRLVRDPQRVRETLASGKIQTYGSYNSNWYSYPAVQRWMEQFWGDHYHHFHSKTLDPLRAEPAQLCVYDPANRLEDLFARWTSSI